MSKRPRELAPEASGLAGLVTRRPLSTPHRRPALAPTRASRPWAALSGLLGLTLVVISCQRPEPVIQAKPPSATGPRSQASGARAPLPDPAWILPDFEGLFESASPSVVNISAAHALPIPADLLPKRERAYWRALARSLGSGFSLDTQGHVVTCSSVIQDAEQIEVLLANGRRLPARLVAADPITDLAVLKVRKEDAPPPLPIADEGATQVGDWVAAFGYPFGLSHSISAGIVSTIRTGQQLDASHGLILSDAAINPGSNGGPLLSSAGRVVGINQIPAQGGTGLGVAIPIHDALPVIAQLKTGAPPRRPWLGASIQYVDASLAGAFELPEAQGALLTRIQPKGPADKAGLRVGDVIIRFAGRTVEDPQALIETVQRLAVGRPVQALVVRDGKRMALSVTPRAAPP